MSEVIESVIPIPGDVQVALEGKKITVTGAKGKVTRDFSHAKLQISMAPEGVQLRAVNPRKLEHALLGTIGSHINNMVKGVTEGYTYKMKIVFVHFPTTVKVVGSTVQIENFLHRPVAAAQLAQRVGRHAGARVEELFSGFVPGIPRRPVAQTFLQRFALVAQPLLRNRARPGTVARYAIRRRERRDVGQQRLECDVIAALVPVRASAHVAYGSAVTRRGFRDTAAHRARPCTRSLRW